MKTLSLGSIVVIVLALSVPAHAAGTFEGAMNQGIAAFRAQNFDNAVAWFNYALKIRPNDRGALFWDYNAGGYQSAKAGRWSTAAGYWKECASLYPATARDFNPKIAYANRASRNQFQADFDEFVNDVGNIGKLFGALSWLLAL
jgi:tetratricopeptide (TPR) repeat protein